MTNDEIYRIFKQSNALLEGHFLLTSGRHSGQYFEKFELLQKPELTERVCRQLAAHFQDAKIDVVVGPAVGGILLAHEIAKALGTRAIFTERVGQRMELRRGFKIQPGERVLVVEDVVTTGGSVQEVLDVVRETQGEVAGVGLLVDRSAHGADFGVLTVALYRLIAESYAPEECPLCAEGVPLTQRGSRNIAISQSGFTGTASAAQVTAAPSAGDRPNALVGLVLGSKSDLPVAQKGIEVLRNLKIPFEVRILSAHRTPDQAAEYARTAQQRGLKVIIAGAGRAAHLAGVLAAYTHLPVIGIPIGGGPLSGVDALYSTVQMPPGTPVATVAIDGAVNAALLAARILAVHDESLGARLEDERRNRVSQVEADDQEAFTTFSV